MGAGIGSRRVVAKIPGSPQLAIATTTYTPFKLHRNPGARLHAQVSGRDGHCRIGFGADQGVGFGGYRAGTTASAGTHQCGQNKAQQSHPPGAGQRHAANSRTGWDGCHGKTRVAGLHAWRARVETARLFATGPANQRAPGGRPFLARQDQQMACKGAGPSLRRDDAHGLQGVVFALQVRTGDGAQPGRGRIPHQGLPLCVLHRLVDARIFT